MPLCSADLARRGLRQQKLWPLNRSYGGSTYFRRSAKRPPAAVGVGVVVLEVMMGLVVVTPLAGGACSTSSRMKGAGPAVSCCHRFNRPESQCGRSNGHVSVGGLAHLAVVRWGLEVHGHQHATDNAHPDDAQEEELVTCGI